MIRMFLRDGAVYAGANVLVGVVGIILMPVLTRHLAPADYGALDLCYLLVTVLALISTAEIHQGLARFYHEADPGSGRSSLCRTAFLTTGVGAGLGCVVIAVGDEWIARAWTGSDAYTAAVRLSAQNLLLGSMFALLHRQLRWALRPLAYLLVAMLAAGVNLVVTLMLLFGVGLGIEAPLWGQASGFGAGGLLAAWMVRKDLAGSFSRTWLRQMLVFSAPLVVSSLGMIAMAHIGRSMLGWLMSLQEVAVFSVAMRISGLAGIVLGGIISAVTPLIYAHYRADSAPRDIVRMLRGFLCIAVCAWAGVSLFAPYLVDVLADARYGDAATIIPALVVANIWASLYVFFPGLDLARRTWRIAAIHVGLGLFNIVLSAVLIAYLGLQGAAAATMISSLLHGLAYRSMGQGSYALLIPAQVWSVLIGITGLSVMLGLERVVAYTQYWGLWVRGAIAFLLALGALGILWPRFRARDSASAS